MCVKYFNSDDKRKINDGAADNDRSHTTAFRSCKFNVAACRLSAITVDVSVILLISSFILRV